MSERLRQIKFSGFRGLPDYTCDLKGRNLLVCGGNGMGKSAIVDGLEFFFGGSVARFRGEGTGNIDHDRALRNIQAKQLPSVTIALVPANTTHTRVLGKDIAPPPAKDSVSTYLEACREPTSYILRRARILAFIESQDSDRYQRLVGLLGLRSIHAMQEAFVQATQEAGRRAETAAARYRALLESFEDKQAGFRPGSVQGICDQCAKLLEAVGLTAAATHESLAIAEGELGRRRPPEVRKRLDSVALALGSLSVRLGEEVPDLVRALANAEKELTELAERSPEAEQLPILSAGHAYFAEHVDLQVCPLCEQPLLEGYAHVLARLKIRREALARVDEARKRRDGALSSLIAAAEHTVSRLNEDLRQVSELEQSVAQVLSNSRESLVTWIADLRSRSSALLGGPVVVPERMKELAVAREDEAKRLTALQIELVSKQDESVEKAASLLRRYLQNESALADAEATYKSAYALSRRAEAAEQAFTRAREDALSAVLKRMAEQVLAYYVRLHDADGSECTKVEFQQTGRARAGGLRFVIEFLGMTADSDPRAYLSEGHLDSLGLCIYLATAKLFNTPGIPLVLDDVLTSADREHRHRVADLLLEEFSEFQLILTTHDERWFDIFQSKAAARGDQQSWRFQRIANWSLAKGPESAAYEGTWDYIENNLNEDSYRELGGALRLVLEDFMKRVAERIELEVKYRISGQYTVGDFETGGLVTELREKLVAASPPDEAEVKKELARAFGDASLINYLSHDNPGRLEVTLQQVRDFVDGLRRLTELCERHRLIKGSSS